MSHFIYCYAECHCDESHYAECYCDESQYAECHYAEWPILFIVMLSDIILLSVVAARPRLY